jgi:hypothetical protein
MEILVLPVGYAAGTYLIRRWIMFCSNTCQTCEQINVGKNPSLVGNDLVCTFVPRSKTYLRAKRTPSFFGSWWKRRTCTFPKKLTRFSKKTYVFLDVRTRVSRRAGTCYYKYVPANAASMTTHIILPVLIIFLNKPGSPQIANIG